MVGATPDRGSGGAAGEKKSPLSDCQTLSDIVGPEVVLKGPCCLGLASTTRNFGLFCAARGQLGMHRWALAQLEHCAVLTRVGKRVATQM